jgi:diguanylate cyclase
LNDKFHQPIGDRVMQKISKVMTSSISDNNIAVRFDGDESVVMRNNTNYIN